MCIERGRARAEPQALAFAHTRREQSVPGTYSGTVPGTYSGTVPGTYSGTVPGTYSGTVVRHPIWKGFL